MERDEPAVDRADAAAQLQTLQADRAALADRAMQPWWYDVALGLLVFVLLASLSTQYPWVITGAVVLALLGMSALKAAYTRITGAWVSGLRPGPTRRAIHVWFVLYAVVLAGAAVAEYLLHIRGAMVIGAAVLGVAIALISRWWSRIYIADLREGR